jgi:predicted HTH domain antitoxin
MTVSLSIEQVLGTLRDLAAALRDVSGDEAMSVLTSMSLKAVRGAEAAGITCVSDDGYESVAPTNDIARQVDQLQFDLGSGPCVDAAVQETILYAGDLRTDPRWPEFGRRTVEQTGVLSMISYRLLIEDDDDLSAALNLYSSKPDAFDEISQLAGLAASTYGAELVTSRRRQVEIENLKKALESNRDIGAAIGILMARHQLTRDQAFDLLRMASQGRHRKLADIAADVVDTGTIEFL